MMVKIRTTASALKNHYHKIWLWLNTVDKNNNNHGRKIKEVYKKKI